MRSKNQVVIAPLNAGDQVSAHQVDLSAAAAAPARPSAPAGPARIVQKQVPDEPARGRKPVSRDGSAAVIAESDNALGLSGKEPCGAVLVAGGGVAGIQASLDLSAAGFRVYLVEHSPTIGGGMARLDKTFPTGDCATCIISPKLVECMRDYNIDVMTMSDIAELQGEAGDFTVRIEQRPRGVNADKCTGCGDCWQHCPVSYLPETPPEFTPSLDLDPSERALFDAILQRHQHDRAPLMPILQDINDERGYLPRSMLESLAQKLQIPLAEILRVASFYSAFNLQPVGRHLIEVCLGTACFVRGSGVLLQRLQEEIGISAGDTDKDERFTLRTVRCIGCCALAPAMRVDGITFGQTKLEKVPRILERFE